MMNKKIETLNELRIDRSATPAKPSLGRRLMPLAIVAVAGIAGYGFWQASESTAMANQQQQQISASQQNSQVMVQSDDAVQINAKQGGADNTQQSSFSVNNSVLEASGHITAQRVATVSAKIIGLIEEVYVDEGTAVEAGQALARLDARIAELDLKLAQNRRQQYQAEVKKSRAEIRDTERQIKRYQSLAEQHFSNQSELDSLRIDLDVLQSNLTIARANVAQNELEVEQLQKRLDDHTIRAPFSGVVTIKNAQPGEIISPSSAGGGYTRTGICTIVDMSSLEIEVDVNEAFLDKIYEGQPVKAQLYAYDDWMFDGKVKKIVPTVDRAKATVRVRIEILKASERILPNMAVRVSFIDGVRLASEGGKGR
ncbi:efflux RND transporter periplasmic adaptor subunit [Idiomarina xiamenensis]|uniref:Acriflavin resistance protein n=1 Tax=Idiomarina xiamenensis 10-D-4 TaxID=740709 RepID=K2KHY9_9GAMM|nr:efflux RND transporter periplasmic adaptor subunit [Idiomarina xiamenensis]EKE87558.1 acriflavin resistance protein [Idiomarina xiamenensis 10-D-4]